MFTTCSETYMIYNQLAFYIPLPLDDGISISMLYVGITKRGE